MTYHRSRGTKNRRRIKTQVRKHRSAISWNMPSFESLEPRLLLASVPLTQSMIDNRGVTPLVFTDTDLVVNVALTFDGDLPIDITAGSFQIEAGGSLTGDTGGDPDNITVEVSDSGDTETGIASQILIDGGIDVDGHVQLAAQVDITRTETAVGDYNSIAVASSLVRSGATLEAGTLEITALTTGVFSLDVIDSTMGALTVSVIATNQTYAGIEGGAAVSVGTAAISGAEDASLVVSAIDEAQIQTSIAADDALVAPMSSTFGDVASSITWNRDTQAFIGDTANSTTLPDPAGFAVGLVAIRALNSGGAQGEIVSSLSGSHSNIVSDNVQAFVQDATIDAAGLSVSADNNAELRCGCQSS